MISRYTLVILTLLCISGIAGAYVYLSNISKQVITDNSVSGARRYLEALTAFRTLYTSEVIKTAKEQGLTVTHNYKDVEGAIPLPASLSMALGEKIGSHQSGAKTFLYSRYPFPWRVEENQVLFAEPFVKNAWLSLIQFPDQAYFKFVDYNGRPSIRYAVADKMRAACVDCHNNHPDTPKNDWKEGDVRGVMEVILPINVAQAAAQTTIDATFSILGLITLLLMVVIGLVFTRMNNDKNILLSSRDDLLIQRNEIETQNNSLKEAHQQLAIHAAELTTAIQCKSDFLACMSHEIRTPMNGVIRMLNLLLRSPMEEDQHHKAMIAKTSAESLLTIINDILDFSKVDEGKLDLENIEFNIIKMLCDLTDAMAFRAEAKDLELIVDLSKITHAEVKGDPGRLRQILTNLISNSIKFTEQGEVELVAGLQAISDSEFIFYCKIKDTGIGIHPGKQAALFDAFSQADSSTTRIYGGTGLGLSICKQLSELMGGSISAASKINEGSCFEFTVSLEISNLSSPAKPDMAVDNLSILVIDDNECSGNVIKTQLEAWGVHVTYLSDASAALQLLSQAKKCSSTRPYDAIFVDMIMPGLGGEEFIQQINADPLLKNNKLILMSSLTHRHDKAYFDELGCFGSFPKPATPFHLINVLNTCASNNAEPRSAGSSALESSNKIDAKPLLETYSEEISRPPWPIHSRVLLVEDNEINQMVASGILEDFDLNVEVVANGKEAISALESATDKQAFDLVFMDCQMPVLDGYKASGLIRKGEAGSWNSNIPIVAMTANSMKGDKEKCIAAGMDDYISKPIETDNVEAMLITWLTVK
ncbi:hypothetical protein A9Q81_01810 [Gammaproteobacteria bacterium 42_54_T18]|nr:hypothetical protein A9Q81_01810 [Gammaproteobacteria bacterium 42_54_T18]